MSMIRNSSKISILKKALTAVMLIMLILYRFGFAQVNLHVSNSDIQISNTAPELNEVITVSATIHNSGSDYSDVSFISNPNTHETALGLYNGNKGIQSFLYTDNINLKGVSLKIKDSEGVTDYLYVEIQNDNGSNEPDGVAISSQSAQGATTISWVDFMFEDHLSLTDDTTYWIVVISTCGSALWPEYEWSLDNTGNYSDGKFGNGNYGSWSFYGDAKDGLFKCYRTTRTVVEFFIGDPDSGGSLIESKTIAPVPSAGSIVTTSTWSFTTFGSTDIYVRVNGDSYVAESNSVDNKSSSTVVVGAPGISSAQTIDDDMNGKIDAYCIVFSTKVDDSTLIQTSTCGFDVAGFGNEVFFSTGLTNHPDMADDTTIYIRFDEGGSYDTFYVPQLTYDSGSGGILSLEGQQPLADMDSDDINESDGAPPAIISITAYDQSEQGEGIQAGDIVRIQFSESIYDPPEVSSTVIDSVLITTGTWLDDGSNIGNGGIAEWQSSNYNLEVTLSVSGGEPDLNVGYEITSDTYSFKDTDGNVSSQTVVIGGTFGVGGGDTTPPVIVTQETCDLDYNGYIDAIHLVFSEVIVDTTVVPGDFTLASVSVLSFSSTTAGDVEDDTDIYLTFTETTTYMTDAVPYISYTKGSLEDASSNKMEDRSSQSCSDKAFPAIMSAKARDNYTNVTGIDNDDTVAIKFSEATNSPSIFSTEIDTLLALSDSQSWLDGGAGIGSAVWNVDGDTLTITLSTSGSAPDITTGTVITVSTSTIKKITDSNGNICASSAAITGNFDIPDIPVPVSAVTVDDNENGRIDGYKITLSHSMDDSTLVQTSTCGFKVTGYDNEVFFSTGLPNHSDTADNNEIYIRFDEGSTEDTGTTPQLLYISTSGLFSDIYGQAMADIEISTAIESDGASPVLLSATAADGSGGNPGIQTNDKVTLSFSESVDGPPTISAGNIDEILVTTGTFRDGNSVIKSAVWSAQDTVLTVTLLVSSSTLPDIAPGYYITTDTETFIDSSSNVSSSTVELGGNFGLDVTSPTVVSRETCDLNGNGYIDAVYIKFSENIDDSSVYISSIDVSGVTMEAFSGTTEGDTVDDEYIYITFTDGVLTTAATPDLEIVELGVSDAYGNGINTSDQPCADKAPPVVWSAKAKDNSINTAGIDNDDTVIIYFSEATDFPTVDKSNIDTLLVLSDSKSWLDGSGEIGSSPQWNVTKDTLTITLSTSGSIPDITTGTVITVSSTTLTKINDTNSNICVSSITLTGSFDIPDAPEIVGAETLDDDENGQIDGYKLTFSHAMDDSTLVQTSTCGFNVSGYDNEVLVSTVTHSGDEAGDEVVYISFNESGSSDTDALPEVVYFSTSGLFTDIYTQTLSDITSGGVSETDGSSPILVSAAASDNSGGTPGIQTNDYITLTFSESISGSPILSADNIDDVLQTTGTFKDGNNAIKSSTWPDLDELKITLLVSSSTLPTIEVGYLITADTETFVDTAGNVSSSTVVLGGSFGIDITSPTIVSRETCDLNGNGYIDAVYITFSENIDDTSVYVSSIDVSGVSGEAFTGTTNGDTADNDEIYVTVTDGVLSTGETPDLIFTEEALRDLSANGINGSNQPCADKAAPVILSALAEDNYMNVQGVDTDDTVIITFSENTLAPGITSGNIDTVFALSDSKSWLDGGGGITDAEWNGNGNILTVTFSTATSVPDITTGTVITHNGSVADSSSNSSVSTMATTGSFDIPDVPVIVSAATVDDDCDGKIDGYCITLSHAMDDSTLVQSATNGFSVTSYGNEVLASTAAHAGDETDDEIVYISFDELGTADSNAVPELAYTKATGQFKDVYGQDLENNSSITETDGAAPVLLSATASDNGGGGGIQAGDYIRFIFSESINGQPFIGVSNIDSVFSSTGTFQDGNGEIGMVDWESTSIFKVNLTVGGSDPTVTPGYNITTDSFTFIDIVGNSVESSTIIVGNFGEYTTPPTMLNRWTMDLDTDGYIDAICMEFDRSINDSSVIAGSFTLSGVSSVSFSTETAGDISNDDTIYITFTDSIMSTAEIPNLSWQAGALQDFCGQLIESASGLACSDKAPPAIISAVASDGNILMNGIDSDDTIKLTFSEAISDRPTIDNQNINNVLLLSGTTDWENISTVWSSTGVVLTIYFGSNVSSSIVKVGDTITASSTTIQLCDSIGNNCIDSIGITGLFAGTDTQAPTIVSCIPADKAIDVENNAGIYINFSERMDSDKTETAISVREIKNNYSQTVDNSVTGSISNNTGVTQFVFAPGQNLKNNYTYEVLIGSGAADTIGNYLGNDCVFSFKTISNYKEKNIYLSDDKLTKIEITQDTMQYNFSLKMNTSPLTTPEVVAASKITNANDKLNSYKSCFTKAFNNTLREFTVYDSSEKIIKNFDKNVYIQIPYEDANNDGFIDNVFPYISQESLSIYYLNEEDELWVKIPSVVDTVNKLVMAEVAHFSVFIVLGADYTDLSRAYAYPVPFKSSEGHEKITFTNLSSRATIKIYTVSGSLVNTLRETDGDHVLVWQPVTNKSGDNVASGVYLYYIYNDEENKKGKLVIIR